MDKFGNGEARNFHLTVHLILAPKRPQRRGINKISIQSKVKIEWHHFFSLNSISRLPNYFDFNLAEDRKKNRQEKYHKELNGEKNCDFFFESIFLSAAPINTFNFIRQTQNAPHIPHDCIKAII